jgi:CO dehydrogenase/acetyl-CoA synthase delta subunit
MPTAHPTITLLRQCMYCSQQRFVSSIPSVPTDWTSSNVFSYAADMVTVEVHQRATAPLTVTALQRRTSCPKAH